MLNMCLYSNLQLKDIPAIVDYIAKLIPNPDEKKEMRVRLIVEEYLTNVVKYGTTHSDVKTVSMFYCSDNDSITFYDWGSEFDINAYAPKNANGSSIGGHGIRLIKHYCKQIKYNRDFNENRTVIYL